MEESPCWLSGGVPAPGLIGCPVRRLGPETQDGEGRVGGIEGLGGGCLPRIHDGCPDGASCGAPVCHMHDRLLALGSGGPQARGSVALVALTLISSLQVTMVYVDVQVMALFLGDGGVRDRFGDFGQPGATLLGGEAG